MNWAWANSLDQIWRSMAFPMWLTLAAAGFFAVIVLITLLRAEKSVANGALTVITLLAVGIAVAATIRGFGSSGPGISAETRSSQPIIAAVPALFRRVHRDSSPKAENSGCTTAPILITPRNPMYSSGTRSMNRHTRSPG